MPTREWLLTGNASTNPSVNFLGTTDNQPLVLKTVGAERFRVGTNGDIGIGTTSPDAPLHLAGGNWDVTNTEGDLKIGNDQLRLKVGVALAGGGAGDGRIRAVGGTNRLMIGTGTDDTLTIANGNVGIGTITPSFPLHLPAGRALRIEGGTNANDTGNYFSFGGNGTFGLDAPGVPNGRFVVLNSGNVGIGTASPTGDARLTVSFPNADSVAPNAAGVLAQLTNIGLVPDPTSAGVVGQVSNVQVFQETGSQTAGVRGINDFGHGVQGQSDSHIGTEGTSNSGTAVYAETQSGVGVWAVANSGPWAGLFLGPVLVTGPLSKPGGGFRIDHPADPANKYLNHSFVESSEMKNVYDGIVNMDEKGEAIVALPKWFEELNGEFRYQLTAIGASAPQLHVAEEIAQGSFRIAGGAPGQRISWQLTGIRKDRWAQAHPFAVEEEKQDSQRGYYLHPELFGQHKDRNVIAAQFPKMMRR